MARARNIKPGFFANEDLAECSPWARLCFAGLWTLADREGRLEDRPKRIKGELFRFDSIEVEPLLQELARFKFIVRYEIDGDRYIAIPEFTTHQTPHYSEKASVIKPPQLQEKASIKDQESGSSPGTKPASRGGRNPLNPDSLNPDSLNPEEEKTRERASPAPKPPKPQHPPEGIAPQVWSDWLRVRKGKRAGPVTETAWSGLVREAAKAGITAEAAVRACCEFGWQGFNAGWYAQRKPLTAGGAPAALSFAERETARKAARYAEMTGGLIGQAATPPTPGEFIDMEPTDGTARLLG